jgi:predicted transcriptional regulator
MKEIQAEPESHNYDLSKPITGCHCSDLLSFVLAQAKEGNIWITIQRHENIVAVANLLGLAGVVLAAGVQPQKNTIEKAREVELPLFTTQLSTFEVAGRLFKLGIIGSKKEE